MIKSQLELNTGRWMVDNHFSLVHCLLKHKAYQMYMTLCNKTVLQHENVVLLPWRINKVAISLKIFFFFKYVGKLFNFFLKNELSIKV